MYIFNLNHPDLNLHPEVSGLGQGHPSLIFTKIKEGKIGLA